MKKGPHSLQGKLFLVLFLCRTYYIRSLWVMDHSVKVLWRFVEDKGWNKECLQWGKKKYGGDQQKWDIVQLGKNICEELDDKDDAKKIIKELMKIRNKYVGHVSGGMDEETYMTVVQESQACYVQLVGTDEQDAVDEITSSKK